MRKIEQTLRNAWQSRTTGKYGPRDEIRLGYGSLENGDSVMSLYLHSNEIARLNLRTGRTFITLAGWNTVTTRSRLNHVILHDAGCAISTSKGIPTVRSLKCHDITAQRSETIINDNQWYAVEQLVYPLPDTQSVQPSA